ncbi:hypothetical protein CC86DRAFT_437062 [Ophiobolus disseminans]|uniref:N-acetyltransferase domain-containing protein n=1 Tax=Ophiobolus disseminans TaxID=1469910 RepID=A0A6A7A9C4_9PLEO|nr:hypothetical protein CC86DRAFT_437062 [Ophiobolus disseminans]
MSFKLLVVDWTSDQSKIMRLLVNSPVSPYNSFLRQVIRGQNDGISTNDRWRNIIVELIDNNEETVYTLKVVNIESGDLVGAAIFDIHSSQTPATTVIERLFPTMTENSPHVSLLTLNVQTKCDANTIGQIMIEWGIEKATSLGIDFWATSDSVGADLYRCNSMEVVKAVATSPGFWNVRRRVVNNRVSYRSSYLNTEGFW